ncbi:MAG TPA: hypothetical protein VEZ90_20080 [Blastocatellia bacterium]|nr:hypothetical protein [Blastocatellia bacterium]
MAKTPGAILLYLVQKFGHGLRTAWYRDVVRPRILQSRPIPRTTDSRCEIHVMTSESDWLNLVWALKSFYFFSRKQYKLCIHDDGSLLPEHRTAIETHFPAARLIDRQAADRYLGTLLKHYPRSLEFRRTNLLAPKVFDFVSYLEADRMLLFDSDLLFFKEPVALLSRVEDPEYKRNTFNGDCGHGYTVQPKSVAGLIGHPLLPRINSGLGLVHKESIRFDWTEEFLALPEILDGHFWRIEQTLIALCSSRFGAELLPEEYTLHLGKGIGDRPFRHYVGRIRHLMYLEGMKKLVRQGLLGGASDMQSHGNQSTGTASDSYEF